MDICFLFSSIGFTGSMGRYVFYFLINYQTGFQISCAILLVTVLNGIVMAYTISCVCRWENNKKK